MEFDKPSGDADDEDEEVSNAEIDEENVRRAPQVFVSPDDDWDEDVPDDAHKEDEDTDEGRGGFDVVGEVGNLGCHSGPIHPVR